MSLELVNKTVSVSLTTRLDCVKLHVRVAVVFGSIFFRQFLRVLLPSGTTPELPWSLFGPLWDSMEPVKSCLHPVLDQCSGVWSLSRPSGSLEVPWKNRHARMTIMFWVQETCRSLKHCARKMITMFDSSIPADMRPLWNSLGIVLEPSWGYFRCLKLSETFLNAQI